MMTGTEKQIAWASDIRTANMEKWSAVIADLNTSTRDRDQMLVGIIAKIIATVEDCTDAATWIDGRDNVSVMLHVMGKKDATLFGTDPRELRNVISMMN